jgi:hypothetical protein
VRDGFYDSRRVHVVDEDDVGARGERLVQLSERVDLYARLSR